MKWYVGFSCIGLVGIAACGGTGNANESVQIDGNPISLLEYVATAPSTWQSRQPASSMRLAEFNTPAQGETAGAEVVVYFFGAGQGGSVEANIERWTNQFTDDAGNHPKPTVTNETGTAFATTFVELRGNYNRSIGMADTATAARPDQVLMAAVVETPRGNLHIQMHGPTASVVAEAPAFRGFVRSIRTHAPTT
jgi:hypothetical protein